MSDPVGSGKRRVLQATCSQHGGTPGFTNLVVSRLDGCVEFDPHAVGGCVVRLTESEAHTLREMLAEWLGD